MSRNRPDFGFNEGKKESMDKFFNMSNLQNQGNSQNNQQYQGDTGGQEQIVPETQDRFDVENVITTSQPNELDPDSNLYQIESIYKKFSRLSNSLNIYNVGPGILIIRISHDGISASKEFILYEGEVKTYDRIYEVRLRSPSANLRYRVTEYDISTISGQTFSGSRYKDRRDRSGVVLYQDDYESPTLKFDSLIINIVTGLPVAGSIARSIDTSYSGDFSIKTVTGINPNDGVIMFYHHPDFHVGKVASQFHFASSDNIYISNITIDFFDGTNRNRGQIFLVAGSNFKIGDLFLRHSDGTFGPAIVTGIPIFASTRSWNSIKLTIDIGSLEYVSATINGNRIDLTGRGLNITADPITARHISSQIVSFSPSAGGVKTVYFDNYIFTEDENLE